ncbi:hypothetical protein [Streptomyces sp. NPDC046859]|uniref:hypothetical protein n=1 Tax=Streptomyces sp. NPDC046859 TaxID=3155734 RepID=UPI0033DB4C2E
MTGDYLLGVSSWGDYRAALARYRTDCGSPSFMVIETRASRMGLGVALPRASMSDFLKGGRPIKKRYWGRVEALLKVCADHAGWPEPTEEEIGEWKAAFDRLHEAPRRVPPDDATKSRVPWYRNGVLWTAVGAIATIVGTVAAIIPLTRGDDAAQPQLRVVGECNNVGQTLRSSSSGFTGNGTYTTEVLAPDGKSYGGSTFGSHGTANGNGAISWSWSCDKGDETGVYKTRVTDDSTGKNTGWISFRVNAA